MNAAESKNLATVLKMLGESNSETTDECYQDLKEPGDFAKFLSNQQKSKVLYPSNKSRVLEDTRGHVYYFKRTINKKNKFGKACRCGVWVCRHYRRLYCCCAVYTFGDTIVGSTGPHNHDPITKETEGNPKQHRLDQSRRLNFKVPVTLKNKVRRHNSGPKVDSIKRSVQRAREQLSSKKKRRCFKKRLPKPEPEVMKEEEVIVNLKKFEEEEKPEVKVNVAVTEQQIEEQPMETQPAVAVKKEQESVAMETTPSTDRPGEKKDTLNEILEILNDLSKNSSHSYQALCSQLLSEYMTGQTGEQATTASNISPIKHGTISSITIPIQDFPVSSPGMTSSSLSTSSSLPLTTQSTSTLCPSTSHTSVSTENTTVEASQRVASGEASQPEISVISSNFNTSDILTATTPRPFVKSAPPPNVTIAYNKEPAKPTFNPDMRPVINIPSLFDSPASPAVTSPPDTPVTSSSEPVTSSQQPTTSRAKSPELPPRSEYNILSDMTSLENLLDILKENSPIRDSGALRCTCKTMLRCNLHDIGPGKKRQPPLKPRKVLTRNDDAPKPARKKYCYRGSKKPYKFIPETFKDCQLPANEDTVIGTAGHPNAASVAANTTTVKKGRGGRRSRGVKPVNLPPPPPPVTSHIPSVMPSGVGLTPISPAPEPRVSNSGNTINLVPVTSVSAPSFENSKLLKAVPIGNGLYRLEEANESEMQAGALSKPIFTTDFGMGNGMVTPAGSVPMVTPTGSVPFSPALSPMFSQNQRNSNKPLTVIEHHPTSSFSDSRPHSSYAPLVSQAQGLNSQAGNSAAGNSAGSDVTNQLNSLLTSVLSSINNGMNNNLNNTINNNLNNNTNRHKTDQVPLMIPATSNDENVSSSLVNQLIERLLSVDSTGNEEKLLEAVNSNLNGITQH